MAEMAEMAQVCGPVLSESLRAKGERCDSHIGEVGGSPEGGGKSAVETVAVHRSADEAGGEGGDEDYK